MANARSLTTKFKSDTSSFSAGVRKMMEEVKNLNNSLNENKKKQSEANKEIKEAEKQLKQVEKEIKKSGETTEEQKKKIDSLNAVIKTNRERLETLREEEEKYKVAIVATNDKIKNHAKALDDLKSSSKDVVTHSKELVKELAAIEAAGTAAAAGIFKYVQSAAEWADSLDTLRDQTGISTNELQKFMYASELVDVSVETMTGSLTKMTKSMQEARTNTGGTAAEIFKSLDVDVVDKLTGQLRDRQEVFYEVIDALGKISNETERDAMSLEIFGRSAEQINPLIKGGAETIKALGDEAEKAGLILEQETLDKLHSFNDGIDLLKAKGSQLQKITAAEMIPAVEGLLDVADDLLNDINEMAKSGELKAYAKEIGNYITKGAADLKNLLTWLWKYKDVVAGFAAGLVTFKTALTITSLINSFVVGIKAMKTAADGAAASQAVLNTVLNANPIGIVISLVAALTLGLTAYSAAARMAAGNTNELDTVTEDYLATLKEAEKTAAYNTERTNAEIKTIESLKKEYDELRSSSDLTAEGKRRLEYVAENLATALGISTKELKNKNGAYCDLTGTIDEYLKKLREQTEFENNKNALTAAYTAHDTASKAVDDSLQAIEKQKQKIEEIKKANEDMVKAWEQAQKAGSVDRYELKPEYDEYIKKLDDEESKLKSLESQHGVYKFQLIQTVNAIIKYEKALGATFDEEKRFEELMGNITGTAEDATDAADDMSKKLADLEESTEAINNALEENAKTTSTAKSAMSELASAYNKLQQEQVLDYDTLLSLAEKYPEYAAELLAAAGNAEKQKQA
ncbi:MAG: hypothetical protein IJ192_03665, partial [Clostridia bacterium]|nr:hypothetical protein [Clostridia bacterium]